MFKIWSVCLWASCCCPEYVQNMGTVCGLRVVVLNMFKIWSVCLRASCCCPEYVQNMGCVFVGFVLLS